MSRTRLSTEGCCQTCRARLAAKMPRAPAARNASTRLVPMPPSAPVMKMVFPAMSVGALAASGTAARPLALRLCRRAAPCGDLSGRRQPQVRLLRQMLQQCFDKFYPERVAREPGMQIEHQDATTALCVRDHLRDAFLDRALPAPN